MRHKNNEIKIGKKLKNARIACGYTQEQVAELLNCSNRYLGQLETNRSFGTISMLIDICNLYQISLDDLYSDYLDATNNRNGNSSSVIGYSRLSEENRAIIDNNIQFLNSLQNSKK